MAKKSANRGSIQQFATNLRKINSLGKSVTRDETVYSALAHDSKTFLEYKIWQKTVGLTWGKGKQQDYGVVEAIPSKTSSSVRLSWSGDYVRFVEYGAGKSAVEHPYQGDPPINYMPSDDEHRKAKSGKAGEPGAWGQNWSGYTNKAWYLDKTTASFGWEPLAPFYEAMLMIRDGSYKRLGYTQYEKAVGKAVRKAWNKLVPKGQ